MTMLMLDGFEGYSDAVSGSGSIQGGLIWGGSDLNGVGPRLIDHDGRGVAFKIFQLLAGHEEIWTRENVNLPTMTVGVSMLLTTLGGNLRIIGFGDEAGGGGGNWDLIHVALEKDGGGNLSVVTNRGGNTYPTTGQITAGAYYYIELQCETLTPITAHVKARLDGITIFDQVVATVGNYMSNVGFYLLQGGGTGHGLLDDFYMSDDTNFYGPLAIKRVPLTQATHAALSPVGAGTPQECIDEEVCDLDATYVVSATPTSKQTFTGTFTEPPMFILLSSQTRSEALSATGQRFIDGPNGAYREHATGYYPEEYASKPQILSTLYDGSALTQSGALAQEFGFEIVNE